MMKMTMMMTRVTSCMSKDHQRKRQRLRYRKRHRKEDFFNIKIHCSYQKSKVPAGGESTADTAQEILATIPDAELPEVDPTKRLTSLL